MLPLQRWTSKAPHPRKPPRRSRGEGAITDLGKGRFRGAIWLAVRVNP
jgi:hypothetical protein